MKKTEDNIHPIPGISLDDDVKRQLYYLAGLPGNHLANAEHIAQTYVRSRQAGRWADLAERMTSARRRRIEARENLRQARRELAWTEPKILVTGAKIAMALPGIALFVILLGFQLCFGGAEQFAAGKMLRDVGFAGVTTTFEGSVLTFTAISIGVGLAIGFDKLRPGLRRRVFVGAFALLIVVGILWAGSFAVQAEAARLESLTNFHLLDGDHGPSLGNGGRQGINGWSAGVMFFSLTVAMMLTSFLGKIGLSHYLDRYRVFDANVDYTRAGDDVNLHADEVRHIDIEIATICRLQAASTAEEEGAVAQARAIYLAFRREIDRGDEPPAGATPVPTPSPVIPPDAARAAAI